MPIQPKSLLAAGALAASAALLPALAQGETTLPVVDAVPVDMSECTVGTSLRGTGAVGTCNCQAGSLTGSAWGTDVYTDDSAICAAARHAGVIGTGGGRVYIQALPGRSSYAGSNRNGVSTSNYGSWSGSYRFVAVGGEGAAATYSPTTGEIVPATQDVGVCDSAATWRGRVPRLTCSCPANANNSRSVWGTDTYTDDSYICKAALHAGAITARGGQVTIELTGGLSSYKGTTRNGVTTSNFGSWGGSYRFVK